MMVAMVFFYEAQDQKRRDQTTDSGDEGEKAAAVDPASTKYLSHTRRCPPFVFSELL